MTMRERIARAIKRKFDNEWDATVAFHVCMAAADAVLTEMREPDEAMIKAGLYDESDTVLGSWQSMIDVARKDPA